ncbi:MAG: hypothetical protein ACI4NG_02230 [Candidatus Gallimonas sp.]
MVIDIIDLTSDEYSNLSAVQLAMVRAAQAKKDKILADAEERKGELFRLTLSNRTARSTALRDAQAQIDERALAEIETVRSDLKYQIAYEGIAQEGNENGPYRYPENPNYNLTYSQRFLVVRNYYMSATSDPNARLQAYSMDTLAREYLGEFYQTLYELLASYC